MDTSTEELLFDRSNLGEPRASRDLSFLDWQAGLDEDSAKPRRIEATAATVVRMESAEADTFLIDRMWRSINLRHPFSLDCIAVKSLQPTGAFSPLFAPVPVQTPQ